MYATPGLTAAQIPSYFKDASFGVRPGNVERTYSPRADVTIQRDKFGVPHIYGAGRRGTMFGAGYVAAEDRLFMIDALRHAARAQLSSFAGGSNAAMDAEIWADTPYNEAELQLQYDRADELYGPPGVMIQNDVNAYVAGVNKFINEACGRNPAKLPGEYGVIDPSQSICLPGHEWKVADVIAIASLVAGIFGKGGGGELGAALALQAARQRFGAGPGRRVWADFQAFNDPEAPTTVRGNELPVRAAAGPADGGRPARPGHRPVCGRRLVRERGRGGLRCRLRGRAPGRDARAPAPARRSAPPTRCSSRPASRRAAIPSPSWAPRSATGRRRS